MADKLSEAAWTGFTKKNKLDLDDGALVKALARFDKSDEGKPEPRSQALEDVVDLLKKQVVAQSKRKKELGDKIFGEVKDKLYALLGSAEAELKKTQATTRASAEADDDEESPALLTSKMIPLIRELRKGEAVMQSLIATTGKETVVLLSRRAISPARGKLLKEQMHNASGLKFIRGECTYEANALTFIVQASAGGLARKIKAALLQQTALRLAVRVRGEDGDDADEEQGHADGEGQGDAPQGQGSAGADAGPDTPAPTPPDAPSSAQLAYDQRLGQVQEPLRQALAGQHPEATKLRALIGFASEKAAAKDYAAATQALEHLHKLLDAPAGVAKEGGAKVDAGAAFNARLAALLPRIKEAMAAAGPAGQDIKLKTSEAGALARKGDHAAAQSLLDAVEAALESLPAGGPAGPSGAAVKAAAKACLETWLQAKEAADVGLSRLQSALKSAGDPALQRIAEYGLAGVSRGLQVGLRVALQEFALATDRDKQAPAAQRLRASVGDFRRFLATDPAVQLCDENPFDISVELRPTLGAALRRIDEQLDALQ
ncbi:hypothetical protein [Pseudorhodoferax sp. Leaf274]|uniref:hypothetical protein n=1 Tax=Pseudorhodoferax sp. Leaf274 TaxID=1736318 RepID=UPI0007027D3A|nr:hypothetical protein [Pseudorhodoferax sp. Leaf274]KQP38986.1 hypothetical protein ASF44_11205 [Pseudorhodoferax sp. Leaf274]